MSKSNQINIGCGGLYHHDWTNVDFNPSDRGVINADIRGRLPFRDNKYEYAYSSHVIEHLTRDEGLSLLREIHRILKPKGILRIVIPDLEKICSEYLKQLRKSSKNNQCLPDYRWIYLMMYDQTVRTQRGGDMLKYITQKNIPNVNYLIRITGDEVRINSNLKNHLFIDKIISLSHYKFNWYVNKITYYFLLMINFLIGGSFYKNAFVEGVFRNSGEIHKTMYDRLSLSLILKEAGYKRVRVMSGYKSQIKDFTKYELDAHKGGLRKPESLFVEARK